MCSACGSGGLQRVLDPVGAGVVSSSIVIARRARMMSNARAAARTMPLVHRLIRMPASWVAGSIRSASTQRRPAA